MNTNYSLPKKGNFVTNITPVEKTAAFADMMEKTKQNIDKLPAKTITKLIKDYNAALTRCHVMNTKKELLSTNVIDARSLFKQTDDPVSLPQRLKNDSRIMEYQDKNDWLSTMPCFNEGVLRPNEGRYIYWKILDVKTEEKSFTIFLHDYIQRSPDLWETSVTACCKVTHINSEENGYQISVDNSYDDYFTATLSALYSAINLKKDLKWTKQERTIWKKYVVTYAENSEREMALHKQTSYINLVKVFLTLMLIVNGTLAQNKPSKAKHHTKTITEKTVIKTEQKPTPERVIRTVGTMLIQSEKPPKVPTEKTVIKYVVASWPTRGHIRHYKSGKTVYIKPSTHHRKCLQKDKEDKTKQTIVFKDNSPERKDKK